MKVNDERTNVNDNAYRKADDAMSEAALKALTDRDIVRPDELLACNTPVAVLAWCKWWDGQRNVGKELLADRIRTGRPAPQRPRTDQEAQREYLEGVRRWLIDRMPDVCRQDPEVIEWEHRVYGDLHATRLEAWTEPHYAAVAAVIRLHHQHGKGSLTANDHGPEIRAAVKRANKDAIADYRLIAGKREKATA